MSSERPSVSGRRGKTTKQGKRSIANPIYDLAVIVTLLVPIGAGVALASDRLLSAAVLSIVLVVIDLGAILVGKLCRLQFRDYLESLRPSAGRVLLTKKK